MAVSTQIPISRRPLQFPFVCYWLVIEMIWSVDSVVCTEQLDDAPVDLASVGASLAVALVPAALHRSNIGMRSFNE